MENEKAAETPRKMFISGFISGLSKLRIERLQKIEPSCPGRRAHNAMMKIIYRKSINLITSLPQVRIALRWKI